MVITFGIRTVVLKFVIGNKIFHNKLVIEIDGKHSKIITAKTVIIS